MSDPDEDLAARLTDAAQAVTDTLTTEEVAAIRAYQGVDRTYELVSAVVRGLRSPSDLTAAEAVAVARIIDLLPVAIARWRTPEPLRVYRGQRSVTRLFGAGARRGRVLDAELVSEGYGATIIPDLALGQTGVEVTVATEHLGVSRTLLAVTRRRPMAAAAAIVAELRQA